MKRIIILCVYIAAFSIFLFGSSPKREIRASWLATVWRLDWPSAYTTAASPSGIQSQQKGLRTILDSLKRANMNAVFFQVRGMCDAMYESSYEPWSVYISGTRGTSPGYDPLQFAIEEAHKRGLELHAWINPYRYSSAPGNFGTLPQDYSKVHPEWLLTYPIDDKGNQPVILNPGLPEVIQQIKSVVGEIVTNYDVDGILFDDYFYPYVGTPDDFDQSTQDEYKPEEMPVGDWRRENVNRMVAAVYDTIQQKKPYLRFGVSPFGTWTNDANVAKEREIILPSGIGSSMDAYSEIYCDPVAWLEEGTVDYISPQIYWTTDSSLPYGILAKWWSEIASRFEKHFYASQTLDSLEGVSSLKSAQVTDEVISLSSLSTLEWPVYYSQQAEADLRAVSAFPPSEIGLQIDYNRAVDLNGALGSIFYRTKFLVNVKGFVNYLRTEKFTNPSLIPAVDWKAAQAQASVENISCEGQSLTWEYDGSNVKYTVYAIPLTNRNDGAVLASSRYLQGISYSKSYTLPDTVSPSTHAIAVAVLDRFGNEYIPRILGEGDTSVPPAGLVYPADGQSGLVLPFVFEWTPVPEADMYIVQLAGDDSFLDVLYSREVNTNMLSSVKLPNLEGNTTYYWRVVTRRANAPDSFSETRSFESSGYFKIISPADGSSDISLTPTFQWGDIGNNASYTLEIATNVSFASSKRVYTLTTDLLSHTMPSECLVSSTTYYARVRAVNDFEEVTSPVTTFKTESVYIPVPQIISPQTEDSITGTRIEVCWAEQMSKGFKVELSPLESFPILDTKVKSADAFVYCETYEGFDSGVYYIRVKANNETGLTEPSNVIKVYFTNSMTSLDCEALSYPKCVFYHENGSACLNVTSDIREVVTVNVYTISGLLLDRSVAELNVGDNLILMKKYPNGVYLIELQASQYRKVIKASYLNY